MKNENEPLSKKGDGVLLPVPVPSPPNALPRINGVQSTQNGKSRRSARLSLPSRGLTVITSAPPERLERAGQGFGFGEGREKEVREARVCGLLLV